MKVDFDRSLKDWITAGYALIQVTTHEERRFLAHLEVIASDLGRKTVVWSASRGLHGLAPKRGRGGKDETLQGAEDSPASSDLAVAIETCEAAVKRARKASKGVLFVFLDPYPYLSDRNANPIYRRRLRDFANDIRTKGYSCTCLIVSPSYNIPCELNKEILICDFPLPTRHEVQKTVDNFVALAEASPSVVVTDKEAVRQAMVEAALGLTQVEIENGLSVALVNDRQLSLADVDVFLEQKKQIARTNGIIDFIDLRLLELSGVGGLDVLKDWLTMRRKAFSGAAIDAGIRRPKGVLLTGVPGCGKSLSAKCAALGWGFPLLKLDMGKIFSSLVGSSEQNVRDALATAEAIAPCVLWIDEIEKGLPHQGGHVGDSGVSQRVLGTFLGWMQDKTSSVFVFATANDIAKLPPEILRRGRFDEVFFIDLPNHEERRSIIEIHLSRFEERLAAVDMDHLAEQTGATRFGAGVAMTGAEIEAWISDVALACFNAQSGSNGSGFKIDQDALLAGLDAIVPLARMRADDIGSMRAWAEEHARPSSSSETTEPEDTFSRPGLAHFLES